MTNLQEPQKMLLSVFLAFSAIYLIVNLVRIFIFKRNIGDLFNPIPDHSESFIIWFINGVYPICFVAFAFVSLAYFINTII